METSSTFDLPFDRLAMDIVGPLSLTESGNRLTLTAQYDLTGYHFSYVLPDHEQ